MDTIFLFVFIRCFSQCREKEKSRSRDDFIVIADERCPLEAKVTGTNLWNDLAEPQQWRLIAPHESFRWTHFAKKLELQFGRWQNTH
jgi:hypothetical protein